MNRGLFLAVTLALLPAGGAMAQGVDLQPPSISAEEVDAAIKTHVETIYGLQNAHGHWENYPDFAAVQAITDEQNRRRQLWQWCGRTSLCVLALLYAGEDPASPKLATAINFLSENDTDGTYATGIRSGVWSFLCSHNKDKDRKYRRFLKRDADWMMECTKQRDTTGAIRGYFGYVQYIGGDHSNSQYGVLGLYEATLNHIEIPVEYWQIIEKHYIDTQGDNGGWGYGVTGVPANEDTYGSMTVAGLASMYIAFDMLTAASYEGKSARCCGRRKVPDAIEKAKAWLDRNLPTDFGVDGAGPGDNQVRRAHGMNNYYIYGVERCGSASGRKTFGGLNWFETGARWIINNQSRADHGRECATSWSLLFLCKGRGAVFYNKLDTGDNDWNNNPRDIANLSRFCGDTLETRINWQIVDINDKVETWLDAPCLFFNGQKLPQFTDEQKQKLRQYTDSGGTLVAEAGCSKKAFVNDFKALAREVWPEWELQRLVPDHPVMQAQYKIDERLPAIYHIHDGCRSRVWLLAEDMACAWARDVRDKYLPFFQFGFNLPRYASDKRQLQNRLAFQPWELDELIAQGKSVPPKSGVQAKLRLADWPTDGARRTDIRGLRHLKEALSEDLNVSLETTELQDNKLDSLDGVDVLHMSGHFSFSASDENIAKVRAFIDRGGLIWADAQCGRKAFNDSFEPFLEKLLPGAKLQDVDKDDPLRTGAGLPRTGFDVTKVRYKRALLFNELPKANLKEIRDKNGRRVLIYSPFDITCGLDGHDCYECRGPERNDCIRLASNILLSVLPQSPEAAAAAEVDDPNKGEHEQE
ncbi:MAG: DUF4159 domain-containing protein [Planctomycetes bacterium]|nr:DUF4159 domain-containing protein [Planctomycetota bacterium]